MGWRHVLATEIPRVNRVDLWSMQETPDACVRVPQPIHLFLVGSMSSDVTASVTPHMSCYYSR